jgi:transposase
LVRDLSDLEKAEREELAAMRQASTTADIVYGRAQDWMGMLRRREGERLDGWLEQVRSSQIPERQTWVRSIKKDKAAVLAGLTFSQNNGQVEGQNTKLTLLKRMMSGRAGFALLCQRVLHALSSKESDASRLFQREIGP